MKNKELVSEIVQTILKTTKNLTTEKGSPECRFGPFSFPLNGRGELPTAGVAVNLTLAVEICWDEDRELWRQNFKLRCLGDKDTVTRYIGANYNIYHEEYIQNWVEAVIQDAVRAYGAGATMTRRFVYAGHIFTARPFGGLVPLITTEEDVAHSGSLTELGEKARLVLSQKAKYILVNSWGGDLALEFFTTLEDAQAVMLSEIQKEFLKNELGGEKDWAKLEAAYYADGTVEFRVAEDDAPTFGINKLNAWADMDGEESDVWHIFECQAGALI